MSVPYGPTGMQVSLEFFPLAWLLFFCRPFVVVDGIRLRVKWGTHFFPLPPGRHHVRMFFPYVVMPECGANEAWVSVAPGQITTVSYYVPPLMLVRGGISVGAQPPGAGPIGLVHEPPAVRMCAHCGTGSSLHAPMCGACGVPAG